VWQRSEKRSFFPWERRGGLIRRLGLYRLGPLLAACCLIGLLVLIVLRERRQAGIRRTRAVLLDAWGQPLTLLCPGTEPGEAYRLISAGPDGIAGGLDRIE
jgi:general secretion pathway protein G